MNSKRVFFSRASFASALFTASLLGAATARAQINGFNSGANFTVNGTATFASAGTLNITTDAYGEANSVYYNSQVGADAFVASFVYTLAAYPAGDGLSPADGFTFLLQDDPRGLAAVGNAGGNLGYADTGAITPSVAVAFNIFSQHTIGTSLLTDGNNPENYTSVAPVDLTSGDPILVGLTYGNSTLTETLTDLTNAATWSTSYSIDIAGTLGSSMGYVGFTGGDASGTSLQQISSFQFNAVPEPSSLMGLGTALFGILGLRRWRRGERGA